MKIKTIWLVMVITLFYGKGFSQNTTHSIKDSINIFYDDFFNQLEDHFIYSREVDWKGLKL